MSKLLHKDINMTIQEALHEGEQLLKETGIEEYAIDAKILLFDACKFDYNLFFLHQNEKILPEQYNLYKKWIEIRRTRKPLQYITGVQEFMGLKFSVNESVLIPRQDTETLVEHCVQHINQHKDVNQVLDLCTGSGCIGISVKVLTNVDVTAVDISENALKVAKENALRHHANMHFIQSNLFDKLQENTYDMIISNPPYIPSKCIQTLSVEVRQYEPLLALDGCEDGLDFYRSIIKDGKKFLRKNGWMYVEIGYDQALPVLELFDQNGYKDIKIEKDLAGLDRIVMARRV